MITTDIKIAWRSLWKHKGYSFINIIGLSTGLLACLIVATVVIDELSYDKHWAKGDNIYRVLSTNATVKEEGTMALAYSGIAPSLKKDLPEVAAFCRASVGEKRLQLTDNPEGISFKILQSEPSLWNVFNFKIIAGSPQKFVKGYTNLVISRTIQREYFPKEDAIGKIVLTAPDFGEPKKYLITGVIEDIPQNSHLRAQVITIAEHNPDGNKMPVENSFYYFEQQYVLLRPGTNVSAFTNKVNAWYKAALKTKPVDYTFKFQQLKDIYLKSDFATSQSVRGSMRNVYIFSAVSALLLLIACINFVNLTISRVFNRAKETGVRKVLGAGKAQLLVRFLAESALFFAIAFIVAIVLYPLMIKPVESYLGHALVINLYNSAFLFATMLGVLILSVATGIYPAWFLSKPKPAVILRDKVSNGIGLNFLKKALVTGQFAISVVIIIVTLVVHNQLDFMSHKELGFDKNNLVNIDYTDWGNSGQAFKAEAKQITGVQSASITDWFPSSGSGTMSRSVKLGAEKANVFFIQGDADLPTVLKLQLTGGRVFNPKAATDAIDQDTLMQGSHTPQMRQLIQQQPLIATRYTAGLLGMKLNTPTDKFEGIPVGFVKDFYSESLHNKLKPTLIQAVDKPKYGAMLVRVMPGAEKHVLSSLNDLYKRYYPAKPFKYRWVSDLIDEQYKAESKLQQLFTCFSVLIIFLACLGLFGLVTFTAEQRIKEIGIRKVLGANMGNIVSLISKDYLWLVITAFVVASPVAWLAMDKWLQNYPYRISLQWWVFGIAGLTALIISFVTISFQSIKAALANPVKSLRSE